MLSSLNNPSSSSIKSHDDHDPEDDPHSHPQHQHQHQFHPNPNFQLSAAAAASSSSSPSPSPSPLPSPRQLLAGCADLFARGDLPAARRLASSLLHSSSPLGDSSDRLAHRFARALLLLLLPPPSPPPPHREEESLLDPYLSFNQITPFLRFAHLTANQAILESVGVGGGGGGGQGQQVRIHIVDLDTSHGLQWPPLLQALADLPDPPASVRITGAGPDPAALLRTAHRLRSFARSLRLPFHFHPLPLPLSLSPLPSPSTISALLLNSLSPSETLAVNFPFFLHNLLHNNNNGGNNGDADDDDDEVVVEFLRSVKAMNPAVVTVAERETGPSTGSGGGVGGGGGGGGSLFVRRFVESVDYYAAMFESMEATVPPGSRERLAVEGQLLGREIEAAVATTAAAHTNNSNLNTDCWRRRGFERWAAAMRAAGLAGRPLSGFALSQARLLLRLHYPSEGYRLETARGAFFLGWQSKPLFSVSSWH